MLPIVFLPGTLCDERVWQFQLNEFSPHFVVNLRQQNTVRGMIQAVHQAPFETFILAGFSMGGYIAQEFALAHPERVRHLILVGSSALGYPPREYEAVLKARAMIKQGLFNGITLKRLREFLHPHSYSNVHLRDLIQSMAGSDAAEVYLRQLEATLDRRELKDLIGQLKCPLTAIGGKQDEIVPAENILGFEKWVKNSEVYLLNGCGHFVTLEKPQEVNSIIHSILGGLN